MKELGLKDILILKRSLIKLEIPEWKGYVFIRPMTVADRLEFQAKYYNDEGKQRDGITQKDIMFGMLKSCIVDSDGKHLFNDDTIKSMSDKDWGIVSRIFSECTKINVVSDEDEKNVKKK